MARRVKVQLADNIKRVISFDPDATKGATLGTDLFLPSGAVATPASLAALLGVNSGSGSGGNAAAPTSHRLLLGLTLGDDHPQYVRKSTLTTRGDLFVRDATTVIRLPLGTSNQFLQVVATDPAWRTISPVVTLSTDLSGSVTLTNLTNGTLAATVVANAITDTKLRDSAALSVIGRASNTSGDPADIAAASDTTVLRRSGSTIGFGSLTATYISDFDEAAQDAVGNSLVDSSEINFTYTDGSNTITATLIDASITFARLQNIATTRILGRTTAGSGPIEALTGAQVGAMVVTGSDKQIQYNDNGALAADADLTWDKSTDTLGAKNILAGNGTVATPAVTVGDAGDGLYRIGAHNLGVAINGTNVLDVNATRAKAAIPVGLPNYTVATLPSAVTAGAGALAFVTDATLTVITGLGLTPTGGGANKVPVYSDGAQWLML